MKATEKSAGLPARGVWLSSAEFTRMKADNAAEVERTNRSILRFVTFIVSLLQIPVFGLCILLTWGSLTFVYGIFLAVSIAFYFYSRFVVPRRPEPFTVLRTIYAYAIMVILLALCIGFFIRPRGTVTTYHALLLCTPLVIIDKPGNIARLITLANVMFFTCAILMLDNTREIIATIVNACILSVMGLSIGRYVCDTKLRALDAQRRLSLQSHTDPLTELLNRRSLFERLAQLESKGNMKPLAGVMMIDIDYFKDYNDRHGHQAGDDCLKKLGALLARFGRENNLELFRYGGEEFLALSTVHTYSSLGQAAQALQKRVWELGIPFESEPYGRVTVSIGYESAEGAAAGGYEWCISRADQAMYCAKQEGRNRAVGYRQCSREALSRVGGQNTFR